MYQSRYATRTEDINDLGNKIETVYDFTKVMYEGREVEAIVDVWCEHTQIKSGLWKEFADEALKPEGENRWGGMEYWFVIGIHPHEAKEYDDEIEQIIIEAASHPRCVGLGEMGLDYHYSFSPHPIQQAVLEKQIQLALRLNKPITIHTREAEEDTLRILKELVPKEHKLHIHCFTDSPDLAAQLLDWFPNLYIGVTGVVSYSTNTNTGDVVKTLAGDKLRIVLETDAPYMVPSNLYDSVPAIKGKRFPICHTAMLPWTAEFVASKVINDSTSWTADRVMEVARENARHMYGV
ncbi:hypothetical protein EST38_g2117 [Candolleomyces aberdarensis]|uniref:Uncharacterized protein n=1 Tax=Candolleomyces aberdarensis TaxID=2316362 RepID=A0A4Q2DWU0_9AGAR|nr:hypothetical protein EST38_g2117 [Candolleomyces aberdarensis]